ncbi:AAA family ATPase [Melittangium boletus]|uniref:AAA family ATPase n=1 Tax=Melittangium boletus TaxID=83453 RepID=UPI003DA3B698
MKLRLLSWSYKNIRGGMRNITIDLGARPARWTLIQMPNGTGKTTTMALLRAALSGEPLDEMTVRDFRPSDETETGEFELILELDDRPYRILLKLDYRAGKASYWTVRTAKTAGGLEEGHLLPKDLRRLITPDFARLFVFDGELAKQIRDLSKQRAAGAVRTLYHLDRLDALQEQIKALLEQEQQRASSVSTTQSDKGLKQLQSRLQTALSTQKELLAKQRLLKKTIDQAQERKKELEQLIQDRLQQHQGLRDKAQEIQSKQQAAEQRTVSLTKEVLSTLRNPAMVHAQVLDRMRALGGKLEKLKLPKTMSAEFFFELAEQKHCICGTRIGPTERENIRNGAQNYLAENQIAVINSVKLAVRNQESQPKLVQAKIKELRSLLRQRHQLMQEHYQLKAEQAASGDTELEEHRKEEVELSHQLDKAERELEALTTRSEEQHSLLNLDWKSNLPLCKVQVEECEARLAHATNTVRFLKQSNLAYSLLERIKTSAFNKLKERVRHATNEKLHTLIPSESIEVSRIEGALVLASKRLSTKSQISEGQSLAVAYAFLTSLFEDAPYRLPFIVDSPAVSLDTRVRREVGELVPELFDQMIMFVISSERDGFADAFYARKGVRYLTIWKETEDNTHVSDDPEYFKKFHSADDTSQPPRAKGRRGARRSS